MNELQLIYGDARKIPLPDESVQCIVTSPPYWGLRKYASEQELMWIPAHRGKKQAKLCEHQFVDAGQSRYKPDRSTVGKDINGSGLIGGERGTQASKLARGEIVQFGGTCRLCGVWRGAFGLEPTIEMYVAHTIEILRELRRVLRSDGVLFWNIGDSYAAHSGYGGDLKSGDKQATNHGCLRGKENRLPHRTPQIGLKPKDLCLVPSRIALAAQADGWWVRSLIIWAKPNPMPESVSDRPTDSYEHILMLTKSERYFWDAEAVREPQTGNAHSRGTEECNEAYQEARDSYRGFRSPQVELPVGRNLRNVWNFPTQPYSGAHFATFPEEIPRRCILAATSVRGCCQQCGAPWERVIRKPEGPQSIPSGWHQSGSNRWRPEHVERFGEYAGKHAETDPQEPGRRMLLNLKASRDAGFGDSFAPSTTIGWAPTCRCRGQRGKVTPCLVLDPFGGSGTTGKVAIELARRAVLLDIAYGEKDSYRELAERRTSGVQRPLLAEL